MPPFKKYKFSDFVDINPLVKLKANEEYSFIEMADLNDGQRYVYPSAKRILTGGARFEENDTLFARITPCLENGKICQVKDLKDGKGFGSTEFLVFRGKEKVSDSNFVFYLSRWDEVRRFAELNMVGTSGRQRVPKDVFENLELDLPEDLATQTRIANILSSLDDKIELNRRTNHTLEQIAQTLFKKYFVDDIDPENLPEGWRWGKLEEIISVKHGYAFEGKYFTEDINENILLTPGNFKIGGGFNYSKFKYYNGEIPNDYILLKNDLIVTMTDLSKDGDTLGYSALTPVIQDKKILHNQRIGKVLFKESDRFKYFLYWLMRTEDYRSFILGSATGTTVKHTSPTRICEYACAIPSENILIQFNKEIGRAHV